MIAKIIVHGTDRATALARLRATLSGVRVAGLETNAQFLNALCENKTFSDGQVSTRFIDDHESDLFRNLELPMHGVGAAVYAKEIDTRETPTQNPWRSIQGFRLNKPSKSIHWIELDGKPTIARLTWNDINDDFFLELQPNASADARRAGESSDTPKKYQFSARKSGSDFVVTIDSVKRKVTVAPQGPNSDILRIWIGADHWDVHFPQPLSGAAGAQSAEGSLKAPMPGVVTILKAEPGQNVSAGETLMVMEAMKMEHAIKAPHDGVLKAFRFAPGDQVTDGALLVEFEEV